MKVVSPLLKSELIEASEAAEHNTKLNRQEKEYRYQRELIIETKESNIGHLWEWNQMPCKKIPAR